MSRQWMSALALLLTLPVSAQAWFVNAKSSVTAQGTVSPTGTKSYANGVDSAEYAVAPAAGYKVSRVTIDGVAQPIEADNTYVVPYRAGTTYRYLVAYFAANTVNITTSAGPNGGIREDTNESLTNIPAGSARQLVIAPSLGYAIDTYSAPGATTDVDNGNGTRTVTFLNLQADQNVSATFKFVPIVTVTIGPDEIQTTNTEALAASISGSGTTSSGTVTYAWTGDAGLFFSTPNAATTKVWAPEPGTYTATLTVTSGATSATDTVTVKVISEQQYVQNQCASCHASRSAKAMAFYDTSSHKASSHAQVTCKSCHDPGGTTGHYSSKAPYGTGTLDAGCQSCHSGNYGVYNPDLTLKTPHGGGVDASQPAPQAQYVSANISCADCHANHDNDINAQFAESAHGDANGEGWKHYDWRSASRAACARCHNGTAFVAKLGKEADATNIFTAAEAGKPGEVLSCTSCHTDLAEGTVRPAGAFTASYSNGATQAFPDVGASNLCVRCHGARENGQSIVNDPDADGVRSFLNSHYLAAGSMVFASGGYEYAGQNYDLGLHQNIGVQNYGDTGANGPCVACHMGAENADHTWEVVTKDETTGVITAVKSDACVKCHGDIPVADMQGTKDDFHTALESLDTALRAKGIHFYPSHPYFFTATYDTTPGATNTAFTNWAGVHGLAKWKDAMGAAFNYNLIDHDPGAYAHNKAYALKLIADSIDFLADGTVDGAALVETSPGTFENLLMPVAAAQPVGLSGHSSSFTTNYESNECGVCHSSTLGEWDGSRHATGGPSSGLYRANDPLDAQGNRVPRSCAACHAPDGEVRDDFTGNPADPTVSVPGAIGCTGCHGDGASYQASVEACNSCHFYPGHHGMPNSPNTIPEKIAASKHNVTTEAGHTSNSCQRCHTLEGYLGFAATGQDFDLSSNGTFTGVAAANNVSCAACHDPHTSELRSTGDWNVGSAQYNLCTSCHNLTNESGQIVASGLEVSGVQTAKKQQHFKDWYRNIASTHYDLPTTGVTGGASTVQPLGNVIEGYVVRSNTDSACTDCHGHELRTNTGDVASATPANFTIHTDWASSAHAGGLLNKKVAKHLELGGARTDANAAQVMAAGVGDEPVGNAWAHYNWDASSRSDCQHCHTAAGAANFLNAAASKSDSDPANDFDYNAANNDFSHLAGWNATDGSNQNELLYCWGCHSSVESGALRATGSIKLDYNVNGASMSLTAPDAGKSAACLSCHSGRGNAEAITGAGAVANPAGAAVSSPGTKSHYLAAGLTINQEQVKAGYTFGLPAASYADPSYYAHDTLGCADCHMTSARSHTFNVVDKNAQGAITNIVSSKCVECHDGGHGPAFAVGSAEAAAVMEEEAEGYHDALKLLGDRLAAAGTVPQAGYPYFSGTPGDQGHSGAMYNYSYLHHEPGAYAHNRMLAKRLIFDSIDWLDNKIMDGSISFEAAAYPHAATWLGTVRN